MKLTNEETKRAVDNLATDEVARKKALTKIADEVNQSRREELMKLFFQTTAWTDWVKQQRALGQQKSKSKVWRKVASFPIEVDQFFTKIYGKHYYKDPDFFNKIAPEWKVYDSND